LSDKIMKIEKIEVNN